ncbi:MAG TPA: potassium channel family protein [Gemmatimonadales bacterium]
MTRPFAALFFTLLLAIGTLPVVRMLNLPDWPVDLLLAGSLLGASVKVATGYGRHLLIGLITVIVVARLAGQLLGWGSLFEEVTSVGWAVVAVAAAAGSARFMFRRDVVRSEHIYAALSAYLLVGVFMGVLYTAIGARSPEAFLVHGAPASAANFTLASGVYFSFVTLATLGYGDIVPATEATRGLAILEAVGGQLYLAVLVASLIGMRAAPKAG